MLLFVQPLGGCSGPGLRSGPDRRWFRAGFMSHQSEIWAFILKGGALASARRK